MPSKNPETHIYLLRLLIASTVTLTLIALGTIPVLGQATEPAQSSPGDPDEVVVPTPGKPKGSLKPPVIHLPDPGIDPAPGHRARRLEVLIPGAAIGATIGGGAGGARVLTSRGKPAVIEKEQQLTFRLEEDTTNRVDPGPSIDP